MTTISREQKSTFVNLLMAKIYNKKIESAIDALTGPDGCGDDYYRLFVSSEIEEKLAALPSPFARIVKDVPLFIGEKRLHLKLSKPRPIVPALFLSPYDSCFEIVDVTGDEGACIILREPRHGPAGMLDVKRNPAAVEEFLASIKDRVLDYIQLTAEEREFGTSLMRVLDPIRSLNKLEALDDSLAKEWHELMGKDGGKKHLPMAIPTMVIEAIRASQVSVSPC